MPTTRRLTTLNAAHGVRRGFRLLWWGCGVLLTVVFTAATPPACDRFPETNTPGIVPSLGCTGDCGYEIVATYPHDRGAFTQGLVIDEGVLYESTGLNGRSSLRRVDLGTGNVLQQTDFPQQFFGEGITVFGDHIIMLTWRNQVGWVFDKESFEKVSEFSYFTEGWGITHDGARLIMSDGSATLRFLDPETFAQVGSVLVVEGATPVNRLNELEYIQGEVFANVWTTDSIVRINPETGAVTGRIDFRGLLTAADRLQPVDVLNGIAYDTATGKLYVTGKLWPKLFEIELTQPSSTAAAGGSLR